VSVLLLLLAQTVVGGDLSVVIAPCAETCRIQVQRKGSSVDLAIPASPPVEISKRRKPAGDPLDEREIDWFTTSSNDETGSPALLVQQARLGKSNALVVTMEAGFEHLHRVHEAVGGANLAKLWSAGEGAGGPRWSTVKVADVDGDAIDEILHFDLTDFGGLPEEPDLWSMDVLRWDGHRYGKKNDGVPVFAAIIGSHPTLAKARAAKTALSTGARCVSDFLVLSSSSFAALKKDLFVVAALSSEKALAEAALARAKKCNPKVDGYVKRAR
jgi:hypothetical protein